jgi:cell division protein ZapA (FtsZ GTPase activity inhibitor)
MAYSGIENSIYHKFSRRTKESDLSKNRTASSSAWVPYQQLQRPPTQMGETVEEDTSCRVSVHIGGMQYKLIASDQNGEVYIKEIADKADQLIRQIMNTTPGMSMMNVTVLSLVNALDELHQRETQIEDLLLELSQYSDVVSADKSNVVHLREINWELKKEVLRLQSIIDANDRTSQDEYMDNTRLPMLPLEEMAFDVLDREEGLKDDE